MVSKKLAMLAAASLVLSSTAAVAGPVGSAAKLSLGSSASVQRAATVAGKKSDIHGSAVLVGLLALTAVIGGTIIALQNKNKPKSP